MYEEAAVAYFKAWLEIMRELQKILSYDRPESPVRYPSGRKYDVSFYFLQMHGSHT
jgi:hypothetical protein